MRVCAGTGARMYIILSAIVPILGYYCYQSIVILTVIKSLVNILIEHALSAFDLMGVNGDIEDARKIWRWIESRQREEFTRSDCQQQLKVVFKRIADIQPGLDVLEERYLILNDTEKTRKAGRPVVKYRVNPVAVQRWEG